MASSASRSNFAALVLAAASSCSFLRVSPCAAVTRWLAVLSSCACAALAFSFLSLVTLNSSSLTRVSSSFFSLVHSFVFLSESARDISSCDCAVRKFASAVFLPSVRVAMSLLWLATAFSSFFSWSTSLACISFRSLASSAAFSAIDALS